MQFSSSIISNVEVSPGYFRLRSTAPPPIRESVPGQFLMLRVDDTSIDPLLRRPFGIFDLGVFQTPYTDCGTQTWIEILYKVVGKGTRRLSTLHGGDRIDILAPLGRGFGIPDECDEILLVGGGIGLAPLHFLARRAVGERNVRLYAGGRTRDDILCITEFERMGVECYVATDDGSLGERGFVTEVLSRDLEGRPGRCVIMACGPMPMLEVVSRIARERGIPCQVSLEGYMACGMGACLGCVVPGKDHAAGHPDFRCVCTEGPVFPSTEILWGEGV